MDKEGDGENPGHVPMTLCAEYRAHIETKIDNMEQSIKSTIKVATAVAGLVLAVLQLVIHFWG